MILRQILLGCGGGVLLALLALFSSIPEGSLKPGVPLWARELVVSATRERAQAALGERNQGQKTETSTPKSAGKEILVASLAGMGEGSASFKPELSEPEPPPASPDDLDPDLFLGALSKQTIIRSRPDPKATILGFARMGALLRRARVPAGHQGCDEGWYLVEPEGYVCVGKAATLDPEHPLLQLASVQADRSLSMPYPYGQSRYPTPPLYTRLPTKAEQQLAEQDLAYHSRKNFGSLWEKDADTPPPRLLLSGERIPRPYGYPVLEHDFMTGRALGSSAFAFLDLFESDGRKWGLTTDLSLLPLDRLTPVSVSEFSGVVLDEEHPLPVAFVRSRAQHVYEGTPETGSFRPVRPAAFREAFFLTGEKLKVGGATYLGTRDGQYIKEQAHLVTLPARENLPKWAKEERSWIDVSILTQTLVAYRGDKPVFATLVSTGRDGLGDPETTHSTAQGVFLIHTKHVTSTMSGSEADDEFDLRDVPYVQYFHEGYAFHAAFWHDGFGAPRSHGCVNLSPSDARHLFSLTDPPVPLRWHSALAREGTLVYIHP